MSALSTVADDQGCAMAVSVHPRTADKLHFISLERQARAVLSDSGTVQEECAIFRVPNVTLRDVTERPETLECGSNILSGAATEDVLRALRVALSLGRDWQPPPEYLETRASRAVVKILLGYVSLRRHQGAL